ncbi:hypothetical protein [Deinococcus koreensis]|uniref:Porin domain-containing protein n=1 Tax=Deinococcus koreensis TaxID=2054903 RepID=A0A2K3V1R6_9DEIO|nr:hypothetical protein [Deinococcus koreensis]PNY82724.1 hypothetical protein CVO96_16410 [Deinococcus koreensis]
MNTGPLTAPTLTLRRLLMSTSLTLLPPVLLGGAGATGIDFGVAYRSGQGTLLDSAWARVGVSDVDFLGGAVSAGVSTRAADLAYARSLSLPPLGAVTSRSDLAVTWQGGVRLSSRATASLGPVALNLGGAYFTTSALNVDPLAAWAAAPTDLRAQGWNADITARYRVNRTLVAVAGGEFGPQNHGLLGVEGRRELTRTLPPAEGDDADTPPETETTGTLTWRLGARAGQDVLAATAGLSYATPAGLSLAVDGLLGPDDLGLSASVNAPDTLGEGSTLRLYAAYEPWRTASAPLRVGAEYGRPLGAGQLALNVSGGRDRQGVSGFGARLGYRLTLGAASPEQGPPEEGGPQTP